MVLSEKLLEVREYAGIGYRPLVDYGVWRVAALNYIEELLPENLEKMDRHDETDEVFILLKGRCILFLGEGQDQVTEIFAQDLEPLKVYNVKRSAWHTHTLSQDATVLIIENRDTTQQNSPNCLLSAAQRRQLNALTRALWGG
jgi:hypothetical protein